MVCRGVVKDGRIELEPGASLREGSVVKVESIDELLAEWDKFAHEVAEASMGSRSILETLAEMRR